MAETKSLQEKWDAFWLKHGIPMGELPAFPKRGRHQRQFSRMLNEVEREDRYRASFVSQFVSILSKRGNT